MKLSITLNGDQRFFDVPANTTLLSLLRNEAGCFSVKHGCETGECGACAVIVDGKVVNSCIQLAAQVDEREVITLEGLSSIFKNLPNLSNQSAKFSVMRSDVSEKKSGASPSSALRTSFQNPAAFSIEEHPSEYDTLHPIQQAFVDTHAIQCGYCTPGMILSAVALFAEKGLVDLPSARRRMKPNGPKKRRKSKVWLPTEEEIRDALAGNLCRCTGYVKPVEAVKQAAEKLSQSG